MLHHVSLGTNDIAKARDFYDPLMDLLGLRRLKLDDNGVHYGTGDILFSVVRPTNGKAAGYGNGTHVAFLARDRSMVDRFHDLAMSRGGASDGEPDTRPEYDPNYYASFVRDPDGNKIEAVTFAAS
jgi:catechol 2,3-dioxygenase-like lactoylglutathione lyase family enzyme